MTPGSEKECKYFGAIKYDRIGTISCCKQRSQKQTYYCPPHQFHANGLQIVSKEIFRDMGCTDITHPPQLIEQCQQYVQNNREALRRREEKNIIYNQNLIVDIEKRSGNVNKENKKR